MSSRKVHRTKSCPPPEVLRSVFDYDAATGVLMWKAKRRRMCPAGTPDCKGYIRVTLEKRRWRAHRLIWAMHYDAEPPDLIDHINGDPSDNRIENLRAATKAQNRANSVIGQDSTSGLKGVTRHKQTGKWQAGIMANGKRKHLGLFDSPSSAHAAYCSAAAELFGSFARNS